jgi:gliding motility-associated protein GldM
MKPLRYSVKMPVLWICLTGLHISFTSCADKIKTSIIAYKALDEGLVNSNKIIQQSTQEIYQALNDKRTEPISVEKASVWMPKAQMIEQLSKEIYMYLEVLRNDLKKEANATIKDGMETFKENDKGPVMRLFEKNGKAKELYDKLKDYKAKILEVDPDLNEENARIMKLTSPDLESMTGRDFTRTFFDDLPTVAALALLSKFENNIRVTENHMANYCNNKVNSHYWDFEMYSAFAVISSSHVKAMDEVEITAGVARLSRAPSSEVVVDGKNIPLDADGAARYKFKVTNKPGKYSVHVRVSYIDQEGKTQTITKPVQYVVADH